jgi:FkbM family methyltransferase
MTDTKTEQNYKIYDFHIDNFDFKIRDIESSKNSFVIISNELSNDSYGIGSIHLNKNDTFIDVGANVGMVSIYVKKKFGCNVIAFEPVPENMENFKENILLNGFQLSDFELHQKAVSNTDGNLVKVFKNYQNMGGCGIYWDIKPVDVKYAEVETVTLAKYLTPDVKYLKMDCEISEYDIIPNIKNNLNNLEYIGIEFHRTRPDHDPLSLYDQIRESFKGKMYISCWDIESKDVLSLLTKKDAEYYKNLTLN